MPLRQNPLPPLRLGRGKEYRERRVKSSRRRWGWKGRGKQGRELRRGGGRAIVTTSNSGAAVYINVPRAGEAAWHKLLCASHNDVSISIIIGSVFAIWGETYQHDVASDALHNYAQVCL